MNAQEPLFRLERPAELPCPELETEAELSQTRDKRAEQRLAALFHRLERTEGALDRAQVAAQIRDLAEDLVASAIRDANHEGLTWRQIGAAFGAPFQTLYRRYGGRT